MSMSASTLDATPVAAPSWLKRPVGRLAGGWGWGLYLILAAFLVPVLNPPGMFQTAIVDGLNAAAMLAFACAVMARRAPIELPLILPVFILSVGSLVAATDSVSYSRCAITLAQDTYLYLWFVFVVNLLRERVDQRGLRIAWMWSANVAAAIGLVMLLSDGRTAFWQIFGAKGWRAVGLFDGPNSLADYLMMSLFVVVSLIGQINGFLVWGSAALVMLGMIATKSNGAISGWLCGMVVWGFVRAATKTRSLVLVSGWAMMLVGVGALGWWVNKEFDPGGSSLASFERASFMGRLERSTESRGQIWNRLMQRYERMPLGIGPGNSAAQKLSVGDRERKRSYRSKEAHNDYIGYLVERGPVALLGLILLIITSFVSIIKGWRRHADPAWQSGAGGALAAALAGGLVATTVHSFVMEKLHFRHYWLFLAMVCAYRSARLPAPVIAAREDRGRAGPARRAARPARASGSWHKAPQSNGVGPKLLRDSR